MLGLDPRLHDDGPELPPDGVPYLPSSVDVLLRMIDAVGAACLRRVRRRGGPDRAAPSRSFTSSPEPKAIGLEIQPALVRAARDLTSRLRLPRVSFIEGDAATIVGRMTTGSVLYFDRPFSGARLAKVLDDLERLARSRTLRLCCVNLPLPPRRWLTRNPGGSEDLVVYQTCDR